MNDKIIFKFVKKSTMINSDQIKAINKRLTALNQYL